MVKQCRQCGEEKGKDFFQPSEWKKRSALCSACRHAYEKSYRQRAEYRMLTLKGA